MQRQLRIDGGLAAPGTAHCVAPRCPPGSRAPQADAQVARQPRADACGQVRRRGALQCRAAAAASAAGGWEGGEELRGAQPPAEHSNEQLGDGPVASEAETQFLAVPWRAGVIWRVMVLWTFAYVIHPQWIIPLGLELLLGVDRGQLSAQGEALLHMVLDLGMLGFTAGILWLCLRRYRPRALGWFRARPWPPDWGLKVLLTCAFAFPLAMFLADVSQKLVPVTDSEVWNAHHLEQTLCAGDALTKGLYALVLTVCAPVWEELIFRGFLLPSLARYLPLPAAVAASALVFACVHFSAQRFAVLLLLGLVFGALYAESRNLLAAVAAHSLWNAFVFLQFLLEARPL